MKESISPRGLDLRWIQNRIQEGYFGPTASLDRSGTIENAFFSSSLEKIHSLQGQYRDLMDGKDKAKLVRLKKENNETEWLPWTKDLALAELKQEWEHIPKGGEEELIWTEKMVAFTTVGFENFQQQQGKKDFVLRDNQIYYLSLLLLHKGEYGFGNLETEKRGVQMHTGEGKTFGFGLAAGIMAARGEQVHVIEPNYVSALNHARQMGCFYEDFFHLETGAAVSVPKKEGAFKKTIVQENGILKNVIEQGGGTKSYSFINGHLLENNGYSGRKHVWKQKIVYTDAESVAFDWLQDHQVGNKKQPIQPNLKETTVLIAEADALMLDDARNPFIISEPLSGGETWSKMVKSLGFEKLMSGKEWTDEQKKETVKQIVFTLWAHLSEANKQGYFREGEGKDYFYANRRFVGSGNLSFRGSFVVIDALKHFFGFEGAEITREQWDSITSVLESSSPLTKKDRKTLLRAFDKSADRETMVDLVGWVTNNGLVIDTALHILLSMNENVEYIGGKKSILLDEYGFPLEKRQLQDMSQVFLQLKNIWQQEGVDKKPIENRFNEIVSKHADAIELGYTTDRITIPALFRKYGILRFSSGTLIPSTASFRDLYGSEVLSVDRHIPLDDVPQKTDKELFSLRCLDGGIANAQFVENDKKQQYLVNQVKRIKENGNMGLFIVSSIQEAEELKKLIPSAEIATGLEELRKRGTLDEVTTQGAPGKIILTTWIAHRDIDVSLPKEVMENGGLDCFVCGLAPSERGLWQALQRAYRGDKPGTRTLVLTPDDFEAIKSSHLLGDATQMLFHSPIERQVRERKKRIEQYWEKALKGDIKAKSELASLYLNYLEQREDSMREQLLFTYIRDSRLEEWKNIFEQKKGKLSTEYIEELRIRSIRRPILEIPTEEQVHELVRHDLAGHTIEKEQKLLDRIENHFEGGDAVASAMIGMANEDLKRGWSDFLSFMEEDFSLFLMNASNKQLTADQIKTEYENRIFKLLGVKNPITWSIKKLIKEIKSG